MNTFKFYFRRHYPLLLFIIYLVPYTWSLLWYKEPHFIIIASLLLLFASTLVIHFVIIKFQKGPNGVLISAIVIWFFLNLQVAHYYIQGIADTASLKFRYPALIFLIAFIFLLYHLIKSRNHYQILNKALSLFLGSFLLVTFVARAIDFVAYSNVYLQTASQDELAAKKIIPMDIDVFYFVFDSYTSSESLKKYYDYDNSRLREHLISKGFKLTENSKSNYDATPYCMSSVFGLDTLSSPYVWESVGNEANTRSENLSVGRAALFSLLDNSKIDVYAYSIFPIETSKNKKIIWDLDAWSKLQHLFKGTVLQYPFNYYFNNNLSSDQKVEHAFIENLSKSNKSAFYFYHFYAPHYGYKLNHQLYNKTYTERIDHVNERIVRIVNKIFDSNPRPFVIVIQGDHGSREIESDNASHPERYTIFNAVYFPDQNYSQIKNDFMPVNTFRLILSKYYGTNIPLLEN